MNKDIFIHKTAIIEKGVRIGEGTKIWDNVHVRKNASIGKNCIIGGKSYIAYDVKIGNFVKINSFAYICAGVTIKDKVMISAGTIFTNDRFPRAVRGKAKRLFTSEPTWEMENTLVEEGVTTGAGSIIRCGVTLGAYSMIGMGSVVTKDVLSHSIVYGVPARICGFVCRCGHPLRVKKNSTICNHCGNKYFISGEKDNIKIRLVKKLKSRI